MYRDLDFRYLNCVHSDGVKTCLNSYDQNSDVILRHAFIPILSTAVFYYLYGELLSEARANEPYGNVILGLDDSVRPCGGTAQLNPVYTCKSFIPAGQDNARA